jgi:hypothetical protein
MKFPRHVKTSPEEQIIVPVPALVSVEVQEEIIKNLQSNQQFAMRNNQQKVPHYCVVVSPHVGIVAEPLYLE